MSDKINYVVTSSPWDENFDEVLLLIICLTLKTTNLV